MRLCDVSLQPLNTYSPSIVSKAAPNETTAILQKRNAVVDVLQTVGGEAYLRVCGVKRIVSD